MIKFYLSTVIIWMIIIWSLIYVFKDKLRARLNMIEPQSKTSLSQGLVALFAISAIPIIRLIIAVFIVYIAGCKQEDFDELMDRVKRD